MHGSAVHRGEARGDLDRADRVTRSEWPHRDHERTGERTRRRARDIGPIHRDVRSAGYVAQFDPVFDQRVLERKRAAEGKAHQIVAPDMEEVSWLFHELALTPHPIARQIAADIEILTQIRHTRVAGLGDGEHWTRLRVRLRESKEIVGQHLWQNDQIGLDITRSQPRCITREVAGTNAQSLARAGRDTPLNRFGHHTTPHVQFELFYHTPTRGCTLERP